ncbi:hypothetical protein [Kitasatospora cathayae]|uniref:Big-1 domain-containing protein n=1 Tax=Kitasatospora cathayae TaxID=3004092 RepID=A0ABY7Q2W7_9ACTN|nr:hypothetical protein [Kitasatospora sp. HUAS 3-15]WBP87043.1 hypothetical protein O1G21_15115 [Kitasatospora sp. HUAS 3-15]
MTTQVMYYQGQDVGLTATALDDNGNPSAASLTAVLTVTDPNGVVTTPTASTGPSGALSAVVPSVSVTGNWTYRWLATGTNTRWAYEDQFTVRPTGVEQLVDLISVKKHLNIRPNDTSQDDELQTFILAAADQARDVCGPYLPEQHTQWFDGGVPTLSPDWLPLASVQSITEYYGLSGFTLTEQPLGGQMNAFAFTVDYPSGQIQRRTYGGAPAKFAEGARNVKVVYTAGRAGVIPLTVRLGALELIRHLWQQTQQGGRPKFGNASMDGDSMGVPMGFALPDRVVELWSPFRRPPGIA